MANILIKNGRVWDGERFLYADVLTENDTIAQIAPDICCKADFTYDAAGQIVSPGLVDVHVHMKGISPETYAILPEMSCLPFGVTAANDAGSFYGNARLLDSFAVKNTVFSGLRFSGKRLDIPATEQLLQAYGRKALGVKVYFDTSADPILDLLALDEICAFARARGLKVMVHCAGSPAPMADVIRTLAPGDILSHVYHGRNHTCADDGFTCLQLAKETGIVLDAAFAAHVHTDLRILQEAVAAGFPPDTVSTDITRLSAYKRGGRYGMTMCMSMARTAGMTEEAIFRAVTSAPAKALGKETQWGYLQEGRVADIAVLALCNEGFRLTDRFGNHMESPTGYRCKLTVCDGIVVFKD